jgi:uncharacterized phage protein gp47/JayE
MSDFGIDSVVGFNLKRLADIKTGLQNNFLQVTDPTTGETLQVDFDENDPFVQVINGFVDELTTTWELIQLAYNQFNPQLASGACLSGLVQLNGIARKRGSASTVVLGFTGSPGIRIEAGSQFTDSSGIVFWETTADIYLDSSLGTASATCVSTENGAFLNAPGTINIISSVVTGLDTVINAAASTPGTADESDTDLRIRRKNSTSAPAQSINEALYASILNTAGVTLCRLYINNTDTTDGNGIPAKTVAAVVIGGTNTDIAQAIFTRIGGAEATYGNTTVTLTDTMQQINSISFVRPTPVTIKVNVDIAILDANAFPLGGDDQIAENIVLFAAQGAASLGVTDESAFDRIGFLPGDDVTISRLYTPINAVPGLKINSVEIAEGAGAFGTSDIVIDWDEIASFEIANITVTETP